MESIESTLAEYESKHKLCSDLNDDAGRQFWAGAVYATKKIMHAILKSCDLIECGSVSCPVTGKTVRECRLNGCDDHGGADSMPNTSALLRRADEEETK